MKEEQAKLQEAPIHAIHNFCLIAFYGLVVLLCMSMIDIFTSDFINDSYEQYQQRKSAILLKAFLKLLIISNTICAKLLIHEINYYVLIFCIVAIPLLAYIIKFVIPTRYTLYNAETMKQLDRYEYQLGLLKYKYEKLTKNLTELALRSKDQLDKFTADLQTDNGAYLRADDTFLIQKNHEGFDI